MQDVRLVAERVLDKLVGGGNGLKAITHRAILLAHDLSPADTIELDVNKIMAFATAQGGKTSHAGILARSLQIPAVVGVEGLGDDLFEGSIIILDGFHGRIILEPDEDELARYTDLQLQFESYQATIMRSCHLPAETIDERLVELILAVLGDIDDLSNEEREAALDTLLFVAADLARGMPAEAFESKAAVALAATRVLEHVVDMTADGEVPRVH